MNSKNDPPAIPNSELNLMEPMESYYPSVDNTPVKTVPDERDESVPAPDSDYVSSMISQEDLDDTTTVFRIRIPPTTQSNYLKQEELSPGHGSSTSTSSSTSLDNDNDAPETPPAFETSESGYVTDSAESPDGLNATPEFNVEPKHLLFSLGLSPKEENTLGSLAEPPKLISPQCLFNLMVADDKKHKKKNLFPLLKKRKKRVVPQLTAKNGRKFLLKFISNNRGLPITSGLGLQLAKTFGKAGDKALKDNAKAKANGSSVIASSSPNKERRSLRIRKHPKPSFTYLKGSSSVSQHKYCFNRLARLRRYQELVLGLSYKSLKSFNALRRLEIRIEVMEEKEVMRVVKVDPYVAEFLGFRGTKGT